MGIKIYSGYVSITPKQAFIRYFIFSAIFNIFGLMACFSTHIHDSELTKHKWLGGLVGTVASTVMLGLVYVLCNAADATVLGVVLFVSYYVAIIIWAFTSKKEESVSKNDSSERQNIETPTKPNKKIVYPDYYANQYIELTRRIMKDPDTLREYWDRSIAEFFPCSTDNDMSMWVLSNVFNATTLPCYKNGNKTDEYYHISHSRYALLDFSIFAYFNARILLCQCADRKIIEESDDLFFKILVRYFKKNFCLSEDFVNAVIDNRLPKYEKIKQTHSGDDAYDELIRTFSDFVVKDFNDLCLSDDIFIAPIDAVFEITVETTVLMEQYFKLCAKHYNTFSRK